MEWFRFYTRTLDCGKVQCLPAPLFKAWVNLLCIARIHDGWLPHCHEIAFRLRCTESRVLEILKSLHGAGLLDADGERYRMHDWDEHQCVSDDVASRVRKHREKQTRNVTCNGQIDRTEQIQSRAEHNQIGNGKPMPLPVQTEYPQTLAAIQRRDPAVDLLFVQRLVHTCCQAALSDPLFDKSCLDAVTDSSIARAVAESYSTGPKHHGTGLLLNRVPHILAAWTREE